MRNSFILLTALTLLASCGIFRGGDKDKSKLGGDRLAVLTYEAKTVADPELANLSVILPAPIINSEWSQAGGSASKALGHLALGDGLSRAWSANIGEGSKRTRRLSAAPVAAGGKVYTIDTMAGIRAFDLASGGLIWSAKIESDNEKDGIGFGGGVSVGGGRVYAATGFGIGAAFDADTGEELWRFDLGVPLRGSPGFDGQRAFFMTQDNQLIAVAADTGETTWESIATVEQAGLLGTAAPAISRGTAVVGYSSGELTAVRVENGRTVWQDTLSRRGTTTALAALADIDASAVVDSGRVYAIGHGGRMVGLDLVSGQRVWERNLAGVAMPWLAGDMLFVVTIDAELVAITRNDGRVRWVSQLPRWRDEEDRKGAIIWRGPVLASGKLYLTNSEGELVVAAPEDGSVLETIEVADKFFLPPIIVDQTLLVLSEDGRLSAYR